MSLIDVSFCFYSPISDFFYRHGQVLSGAVSRRCLVINPGQLSFLYALIIFYIYTYDVERESYIFRLIILDVWCAVHSRHLRGTNASIRVSVHMQRAQICIVWYFIKIFVVTRGACGDFGRPENKKSERIRIQNPKEIWILKQRLLSYKKKKSFWVKVLVHQRQDGLCSQRAAATHTHTTYPSSASVCAERTISGARHSQPQDTGRVVADPQRDWQPRVDRFQSASNWWIR